MASVNIPNVLTSAWLLVDLFLAGCCGLALQLLPTSNHHSPYHHEDDNGGGVPGSSLACESLGLMITVSGVAFLTPLLSYILCSMWCLGDVVVVPDTDMRSVAPISSRDDVGDAGASSETRSLSADEESQSTCSSSSSSLACSNPLPSDATTARLSSTGTGLTTRSHVRPRHHRGRRRTCCEVPQLLGVFLLQSLVAFVCCGLVYLEYDGYLCASSYMGLFLVWLAFKGVDCCVSIGFCYLWHCPCASSSPSSARSSVL